MIKNDKANLERKNLLRTLLIAILLTVTCLPVSAEFITVGQFTYYTNSDRTCSIRGGADGITPSGDLTIPGSITYGGEMYTVTEIADNAFEGCSGFTGRLTIPNSVKSIGSYAFKGCSGLIGPIIIPEGVTSIGQSAFNGCKGLTGSLTIPEGITAISNFAFDGCSGLSGSLSIPSSVTSIGMSAFNGCSGLTGDLVIPNSVTSIGSSAFARCSGFTGSLKISDSITTIEYGTFQSCSGLTGSLSIPENVTSIGNFAFDGCSGLTGSLEIPKKVTSIGSSAFEDCSGFTGTLKIPESITEIASGVFKGCKGFSGTLLIPDNITSIDSSAFQECTGLTGSLSIPGSVTSIGSWAFSDCSGFTGPLSIPEGITKIEDGVFSGCIGLTGALTIPNNVISIGKWAFSGCSGLVGELILGDHLSSVGNNAFNRCTGLKGTLMLPASLEKLGNTPFNGCGFTKYVSLNTTPPGPIDTSSTFKLFSEDNIDNAALYVPSESVSKYETASGWKDMKFIYRYVFALGLSLEPQAIEIKKNEKKQILAKVNPSDAFDKKLKWTSSDQNIATILNDNGVIKGVGVGTATITASTSNGLKASCQVVVMPLPETIAGVIYEVIRGAGDNGTDIIRVIGSDQTVTGELNIPKEVTIEGTKYPVTEVAENALKNCGNITKLVIPSSVVKIGNEAFYGCSGVKEVIVEDGSTTLDLGTDVFKNCSLETLYLGRNTTGSPFATAASLSDLTIGSMVTSISAGYFSGSPAITKITSYASTPPTLPENAFNENVYARAIVNVSETDKVAYQEAVGWQKFTGIRGFSDVFPLAISLDQTEVEIKEKSSLTLHSTVTPDNATDKSVMWSSSDETVATVDSEGNVTGVKAGTTTIEVATVSLSEAGAKLTATCKVNVVPVTATVGGIKYEVAFEGGENSSDITKVVGGDPDEDGSVSIPAEVEIDGHTYPVEEIEDAAFRDRSDITKIDIPNSIRIIGEGAFSGCSGLTSVIIPPSVTILGANAFAECSGLIRSAHPNVISNPFNTGISIEYNPVDAFVDNGFVYEYNKTKLCFAPLKLSGRYSVPSTVRSIGSSAFAKCAGLREITIPASVTEIGTDAFGDCTDLSQVIIEDSRSAIDLSRPFTGCNIDYLYYGRQVTGYPAWPVTIKSLETGRYLDALKSNEFSGFPNLYSLTIGVGMRTVDADAFKNSKITKVIWMPNTPPTGYESIKADINYVSTNNYEFENKIVSPNLSSKFMVDGLVYVFNRQAVDRTCAVIDNRYNRHIPGLDVPHKVTYSGIEFTVEEINDYALYSNRYFTTALIGDGIVSIGKYAMFNCTEINSEPYIGKSVKTIGDYAFHNCTGMPSVTIPDATEYLGPWALSSCSSLENAKLGTGLVTIEEGCFADDSSLKQLVVPANVTTIANRVFDNCTSLAYFEISDRTTTLAMGYSRHNDEYKPSDGTIGGLPTAGIPLFSYSPLKEVYIGGDLSYSSSPADGYSPFYRNDALEKVVIHNNETEISDNEFYGCRGLKEVVVGNDVLRVGDYAFSGCVSIEHFTLGSKVATIGVDAFSDCDKMVEMKSYNKVPPVCGDQALDDISKFNCTLFVPETAIEDYKKADQWKNFFHIQGMESEDIPAQEIRLSVSKVSMEPGGTMQLTATVFPADATDPVVWKSSDETVVTVSAEGLVTATGIGSAVITVTCGNVSATCSIEVLAIPAESVTLSHETAELKVNETLQLTATVAPENAGDKTVVWRSSDETVVTVSEEGLVTATGIGSAVITATCGNVYSTCVIEVLAIPAESIALSRQTAELKVNETLQLTATVAPENASDKTVVWESSDETVVTVSAEGLLTAVGVGEATVTAKCGDVTATCAVKVTAASGIYGITVEDGKPLAVYNLQGVRLKVSTLEELNRLPKGFYIVNGKKIYIK